MAEITTLREAVAALVRDGDSVALEGFTHLLPPAAGHELIRQGRRHLTLVRLTPTSSTTSSSAWAAPTGWCSPGAGTPGVGSLHRFPDAVEHGWPNPLEIEEHSHAGMANRYVAGASNLPFAVLRGYVGTDLVKHTPTIKSITCPFTGTELTASRRSTPTWRSSTPSRPTAAATCCVGHRRGAEGGGAGGQAPPFPSTGPRS